MYFVLHPVPYENEVLSSYIHRLSEKNIISASLMLDNLKCTYQDKSLRVRYNIDVHISQESCELISRKCGLDNINIQGMTLGRYGGVLFPEGNNDSLWEKSNNFWFSATQIKVCPLCLHEHSYYNIEWKLLPVYICTKHRILLVDKCEKCGSVITDINPLSRYINEIGRCSHCGFAYKQSNIVKVDNDKIGILVQKKLFDCINQDIGLQISKNTSISRNDLFCALKILYRLISKIKYENSLIHKIELPKTIIANAKKLFNIKGFTTSQGLPATKIVDNIFNYIVFVSAFKILLDWPISFYRLLDTHYDMQSKYESKTRKRVFGLVQSTHKMIIKESPQFIRNAYNRWVFSKTRDSVYHIKKEFCQDSKMYKYSVLQNNKYQLREIPWELNDEIWNAVKDTFEFPDESIGSGNIRKRAVKSAKIFASAYFYKLSTGCPWQEVPAVKKGLIKPGGLQQKLSILRKKGTLNRLTAAFFSYFKIDKELPI